MPPWPSSTREGFATIHRFRLYWTSVGDPGPEGTVVVLYGGPGATHDHLLPFVDVACAGYRVVFDDPIGCGRSDLARVTPEHSRERDVSVLEERRRARDLGRVHLIGSSHGGRLAIAYALAHGKALSTLVSASGRADVPLASREMQRR